MQIAPLDPMGWNEHSGNAAGYESARTAAESKQFESVLKDMQNRAAAAGKPAPLIDKAAAAKQDKELREACRGFEAMFLSMMYKQMRATVPEDSLFGESNAQKIFEDMRDSELMKQAAESGGVGLADMMYRQLSPQVLSRESAQQQAAQKAQQAAAAVKK